VSGRGAATGATAVLLAALAAGCGSGAARDAADPAVPAATTPPPATVAQVAPSPPAATVVQEDATTPTTATTTAPVPAATPAGDPPPRSTATTVAAPDDSSQQDKRAKVTYRRPDPGSVIKAPRKVPARGAEARAIRAAYAVVADGIAAGDWEAVCSGLLPSIRVYVQSSTPEDDDCSQAAERFAASLRGTELEIHHLRVAGDQATALNARRATVLFARSGNRWLLAGRP